MPIASRVPTAGCCSSRTRERLFGSGGFADLYEDTYYNAILGDIDLEGRKFTYTNPLDGGGKRYPWHGCPCCVGNIPRTLLELPTWMYSTDAYALYVNMYAGSEVAIGEVAGTQVRMEQITDYPWKGRVEIVVHPAEAKRFAIHLRAFAATCGRSILRSRWSSPMATPIMVNGEPVSPTYSNHYNIIARVWKDGDRIRWICRWPRNGSRPTRRWRPTAAESPSATGR